MSNTGKTGNGRTGNGETDAMLDGLFEAAKRNAPEPSAALMARVLADAQAEQAAFLASAPAPRVPARLGGVFEALGGWLGLGGLATATAFGVALGMMPALGLTDTVDEIYGGTAASLSLFEPDYDALSALGDV